MFFIGKRCHKVTFVNGNKRNKGSNNQKRFNTLCYKNHKPCKILPKFSPNLHFLQESYTFFATLLQSRRFLIFLQDSNNLFAENAFFLFLTKNAMFHFDQEIKKRKITNNNSQFYCLQCTDYLRIPRDGRDN